MSTKIFYNNNRIIIDGHADTPEECQAITAMCDSLTNDENFKTIVYEKGHAVFERVDGGDTMMFAMQDFVLTAKYDSEVGKNYPTAKGVIKDRLQNLEDEDLWIIHNLGNVYEDALISNKGPILARLDSIESTLTSFIARLALVESSIEALENKSSKTLPFTADQLIAKLESI